MIKRVFLLYVLLVGHLFSYGQETTASVPGNPPLTPAWAFGQFVWEDSLNTAQAVFSLVNGYRAHDIPVSAVLIDSPWSLAYNDFNWDPNRYPDPAGMIDRLRKNNIKVILWLTGVVNDKSQDTRLQKSETYNEVVRKNYAINHSQPHSWWKGEGIQIDFTNPEATRWWDWQLDKAFIPGVYGWKVDQGEFWFGNFVETSKGTLSNRDFRHYYYDAMFDYTIAKNPAGITIARPFSHQGGFFASVDKMNMSWCGDFSGDWQGLRLQISNIYRSAKGGYGAIACEVGGFFRDRSNTKELMRYAQFGAMTACMINGGGNGAFSSHLPWYHGREATDIYRYCVALHNELIPYLFSTIADAHLHGGSLIKNASYEEESHQVGDFVFTKAITSDDNRVTFHLPSEGQWIDFWTHKTYPAGSIITDTYPLSRFPLFIKSGAILPLHIANSITGIGDSTMRENDVFLIYPNGNST